MSIFFINLHHNTESSDYFYLLIFSVITLTILFIINVSFALYFLFKKINSAFFKRHQNIFLFRKKKLSIKTTIDFVSNLTSCLSRMSNDKIGALIIIENFDSLQKYIYNGANIKTTFSSELVYTIFYNHSSPLHDGAMIIKNFEIVSLSSYLPVSKKILDVKYGARHRAAFGITEKTDCLAFVVSETTGNITFMFKDTFAELDNQPSKLIMQIIAILNKNYYIFSKKENQKIINELFNKININK